MASTELQTRPRNGAITAPQASAGALMEQVIINGDLDNLTPVQRVSYYNQVCESLNLNPLTKPFLYIRLNEKLTLYATRDATDQLRNLHGISIKIVSRETVDGVYAVTAQATDATGRCDESIGAVPLVKEGGNWKQSQSGKRYFEKDGSLQPLAPEERANAFMKAETKSKRRVTLSICGLGMLDETEVDSIRGAERVVVQDSGEIVTAPQPRLTAAPEPPQANAEPETPQQYQERQLSRARAALGGVENPPIDEAEAEFVRSAMATPEPVRPNDDADEDDGFLRSLGEPSQPQSTARPGQIPATPKQLITCRRMLRSAGKPEPPNLDTFTRAQASELISSLIGQLDQRAS